MTNDRARPGRCAIAVMAKAPRPGQVKTRLVPPLTAEMAAALNAAFLRDVTENVRLAAQDAAIDGYVAYAPAGCVSLFDGMLASDTRLVLADGANISMPGVSGFGRCLLEAAQSLLTHGYRSVCLLNSDSPTLPTLLLTQAAHALAETDDRVALGPADDGGYYLLGMKAPHAQLFQDIDWSTSRVAQQTRQRARTAGLAVVELETWYDVDDAAALDRLCRELASPVAVNGLRPYAAPMTVRCIDQLLIANRLSAA